MAVAINKGIYIVAAKRTPFGRFGGKLRDVHPSELLASAAKAALKTGSVAPAAIDTVNVGQVYGISGTSDGVLSPRHAALKTGIPQEKPALGVNRLCGSGFQAIINSAQDILTGAAQVSLAGGTENMSAVPFVVRTRFGVPLGVNVEFEDSLTKGSLDSYCNFTMPQTAENLAEKYKLLRGEVDEFALQSQQRWKAANDNGVFKEEMAPVTVKVKKQEVIVDTDEHPRPETTIEGLCKLPVLFRKGGVVTAGNSSGVNDGAGAVVLASEEALKQHNLTPLVRLLGWSFVGVDPSVMGIGPVPAIQSLLAVTKKTLDDIDLVEINEAFAAQTLACVRELGVDQQKLNVSGGAVAIGHPVGASGARITAHLTHELSSGDDSVILCTRGLGVSHSSFLSTRYLNILYRRRRVHMGITSKGAFVISAKRTPFCKYGGSLRELPSSYAFAAAAKDAMRSANVDARNVDCTVVGNINFLSQCDGGKTPRYCGLYSGVPIEKPALGVNKACGTGLQAIVTSAVDIIFGTSKLCLTGGTEIMSTLPLLVRNVRFGTGLGAHYQIEDHIKKQFPDSYCGLTRPRIADYLAEKYNVKREAANRYAMDSYTKWKAANESNVFKEELTNVKVILKKKESLITEDEISQPNIDGEQLKETNSLTIEGVVTAANSAAPADGASALLLAGEDMITVKALQPLARIVGWATIGLPPEHTGLGATHAIRKLLNDLKKNVEDIDLFEINENFAPEVLIAIQELRLDASRVNVNGGAISMGDPVSASGARIATHLVHQLK